MHIGREEWIIDQTAFEVGCGGMIVIDVGRNSIRISIVQKNWETL